MTSQTINLDLIPQAVPPIIHAKQYDKGQTWLFNLRANDQAFNVPAGSTVTIQGTKADHTGFQYACTYSGSTVTATETQQMTIYPGDVAAEIAISKNDELIASINFIIRVEAAALADDTMISDTELPMVEAAVEAAATVPGLVEDAEAYAVGTRGGVPVTSGDPAYENNAKYYADNFIGMITDAQWAQILTILT